MLSIQYTRMTMVAGIDACCCHFENPFKPAKVFQPMVVAMCSSLTDQLGAPGTFRRAGVNLAKPLLRWLGNVSRHMLHTKINVSTATDAAFLRNYILRHVFMWLSQQGLLV